MIRGLRRLAADLRTMGQPARSLESGRPRPVARAGEASAPIDEMRAQLLREMGRGGGAGDPAGGAGGEPVSRKRKPRGGGGARHPRRRLARDRARGEQEGSAGPPPALAVPGVPRARPVPAPARAGAAAPRSSATACRWTSRCARRSTDEPRLLSNPRFTWLFFEPGRRAHRLPLLAPGDEAAGHRTASSSSAARPRRATPSRPSASPACSRCCCATSTRASSSRW